MKYDVLDFMESKTLRSQLKEELPPAVQCILIAQNQTQPMTDKLAALQERYQQYSDADYQSGIYNLRECSDFRQAVKCFIDEMQHLLSLPETVDENYVFQADDKNLINNNVFRSFSDAVRCIEKNDPDNRCITRRSIDRADEQPVTYYLNDACQITMIDPHEFYEWDLTEGYVYIPHDYQAGDLIRYQEHYYIIAEPLRLTEKPKWMVHSDCYDMSLYCFSFMRDRCHSCQGSYGHEHIPILLAERIEESDLPEGDQPLLALSMVLKGKMRVVDFLESYSNGYIDDLMQYRKK